MFAPVSVLPLDGEQEGEGLRELNLRRAAAAQLDVDSPSRTLCVIGFASLLCFRFLPKSCSHFVFVIPLLRVVSVLFSQGNVGAGKLHPLSGVQYNILLRNLKERMLL